MCPAPKQPAPPINEAGYSLDQSHTAVSSSVAPDAMTMDDSSADTPAKAAQAKNATGPSVTGGAGVNDDLLSM